MLFAAAASLVLAAASAVSAQVSGRFLADDRNDGHLAFAPMTPAEKRSLLTNAENVLTIWSNYDSKMKNYGSAADPYPVLKKLRENIDILPDEDLQLGLADAFMRIRDLHTTFSKPGPYGCYFALTGIKYEFVEGTGNLNVPKVVASAKTANAVVQKLIGDRIGKVQIGDELAAINGESFVNWYNRIQFRAAGGANTFGGQRRTADLLYLADGQTGFLPEDDSVVLTFRNRTQYGKTYDVEIPYVNLRLDDCWGPSALLYQQRSGYTLPGTPSSASLVKPQPIKPSKVSRPKAKVGNPNRYKVEKMLFPDDAARPIKLTPVPGVSSISWGTWKSASGLMGVIYMTDFEPKDANGTEVDDQAILAIRSLLVNELKDTDSIVFDLRDNGGGSIFFANAIPQLFKPDFHESSAQYLRNKIGYNIFVASQYAEKTWIDSWNESKSDDRYTALKQFDTFESTNTLGQAYLKPMAVFNNGRCFSACELFSAAIQDSQTGTIFSEDGETGGGGANVFEYSNLLAYDPTDFTALPFSAELGQYSNVMRVGLRRSVRNGVNNGKLIEDIGVVADYVVRARINDVLPGATANSQYDRIAAKLKEIGTQTGQSSLYFVAEPLTKETFPGSVSFSATTAGIQKFTITDSTGKVLATSSPSGLAKSTFDLESTVPRTTLGNTQIVILGTTNGKQVLKTKRSLRVIPAVADRIDITKATYTLGALGNAVGIYNSANTLDANGWNLLNGKWTVGDGKQYKDNTDTTIESFFTAPVGTKLSIIVDAIFDTEANFDYFKVIITDAAGNSTPLINISGSGKAVKAVAASVPTTQFSIKVVFTSDGGVDQTGVMINSFTVQTTA
ncbi:hypothetical protein HK105_208368 [Polyrhizophydium stewartii]|uniref:Tail specific protease domain-containing protein n=1 Tax=Polyrhizophydium stewartii TaxID=2732419 RepID=A0ABR4MY70_9FUNG|nr:hypothetical protein HK105_002660 [Polyrhizophydium stewartii]